MPADVPMALSATALPDDPAADEITMPRMHASSVRKTTLATYLTAIRSLCRTLPRAMKGDSQTRSSLPNIHLSATPRHTPSTDFFTCWASIMAARPDDAKVAQVPHTPRERSPERKRRPSQELTSRLGDGSLCFNDRALQHV